MSEVIANVAAADNALVLAAADEEAVRVNPFFDALFIAFQSERGRTGFAEDLRWAAGLCRTTWAEEQLWEGLVNVQRGRQKRTHLMYASMKGDVERVRWLLARGSPTELKGSEGRTALWWAAFYNRAEVAGVLTAAGANVEAANNDGATPLYIASQFDCADVLEVLIAAGADVNTAWLDVKYRTINTWVTRADALRGRVECARLLRAAGVVE